MRLTPACFLTVFSLIALSPSPAQIEQMRRDFEQPPVDCRPHTRWWWMGNALSREDITWQLSEMREQGIGGVEQITMQPVYTLGNHPYLSREYFDLLKHAVAEARRLGMQFSINFGGPGWIWGGDWVPAADRNQNLLASFAEVKGGQPFSGDLPLQVVLNPRDVARSLPAIPPGETLVAVVAGRQRDGRLQESSLVDLTARVKGRRLEWRPPAGNWRLMAFWLVPVSDAVNHVSKAAMERYTNTLGEMLRKEAGGEFGKTIESLFGDSFEVPVHRNGIYWSAELMAAFRSRKGYDLARYLPALWWEVGDISPKIRYDVNDFLHHTGMEAFFETFLGWCERNGIKGRIQPYGFTTDNIEGAGVTHIPEMEITAGEKDAVPWFDTRIGPRTYVASGAHLYGRNVVSVEAYTYLHWEQARETLEELKITGDMFLRAGANKFYNSGFTGTPEREFVPSRRFTAEILISPVNTWWRYYRLLSDYVARCSAVLRYGRPVADIAVYSPLANQWTLDVFNARRWTRDFDWGMLGRLLLANGYDFDLMNDDVLVRRSRIAGGRLCVRDLEYPILIVPNVAAMPLESMKRVDEFARQGGVVIALEQVPSASTGFVGYQEADARVRAIARGMFTEPAREDGVGASRHGQGYTYFLRKVIDRSNPLDLHSSAFDPFLNALRRHVTPDFSIDFVKEARRENGGLVFRHRKLPGADIYFVANIQDRAVDSRIAFRVAGRPPEEWDPYSGRMTPLHEYDDNGAQTTVPLRLAPYESTILVFAGPARDHVRETVFRRVLSVDGGTMEVLADTNGPGIEGIPAEYEIAGPWRLELAGKSRVLSRLVSWTADPETRHFSGTARYDTEFDLPAVYAAPEIRLQLGLGDVGDVAEVELNGKPAGVIWMRGRTLDVTGLARSGRNTISIQVTNTLINRVSAWKTEPPLPQHLRPTYGAALRTKNDLYGFEPLPRSGLLGPVRLVPLKQVRIRRD